jgi:hypothetical protein
MITCGGCGRRDGGHDEYCAIAQMIIDQAEREAVDELAKARARAKVFAPLILADLDERHRKRMLAADAMCNIGMG